MLGIQLAKEGWGLRTRLGKHSFKLGLQAGAAAWAATVLLQSKKKNNVSKGSNKQPQLRGRRREESLWRRRMENEEKREIRETTELSQPRITHLSYMYKCKMHLI